MKDTHLYARMSQYNSFRSLVNVMNTESLSVITEVYNNITKEASDHPKYSVIKEIYDKRTGNVSK